MAFTYHDPYAHPININSDTYNERHSFRNPYTIENRKLLKKQAKRNAIAKIIKGSLYDSQRIEPIPFINAVGPENYPKIVANKRSYTPIRERLFSIDGTDPPPTYIKCARKNNKKNIAESASTVLYKELPPYYLDWEMDIKNLGSENIIETPTFDDSGCSSIPIQPSNTNSNQAETKNCEINDNHDSSLTFFREQAPSVSRRRSIRKMKKSITSLRKKSELSLSKDSTSRLKSKSKIQVMKLLTPDEKALTKKGKCKISKRNSVELSKLRQKLVKLNEVPPSHKIKCKKSTFNELETDESVREKKDERMPIENRKSAGCNISVSSSCKSILREHRLRNAEIEIKKKVSFSDATKLRDNSKRRKSRTSLTKIGSNIKVGKHKHHSKERHKIGADKKVSNSNKKLQSPTDQTTLESELMKCDVNDEPIQYKNAHLMANLLSKNMDSNEKIKTKVLKVLSQNHFKDFLDLAVQEHSTAVVCDRIQLNSMLDYIRRKSKKNPSYRSSFLKGIIEILKFNKSENEQVKFIENLFDKWTFSDSIVLDLFTKWVHGRKKNECN